MAYNPRQLAIFEFILTSVTKRVFVQNYSYENVFPYRFIFIQIKLILI